MASVRALSQSEPLRKARSSASRSVGKCLIGLVPGVVSQGKKWNTASRGGRSGRGRVPADRTDRWRCAGPMVRKTRHEREDLCVPPS